MLAAGRELNFLNRRSSMCVPRGRGDGEPQPRPCTFDRYDPPYAPRPRPFASRHTLRTGLYSWACPRMATGLVGLRSGCALAAWGRGVEEYVSPSGHVGEGWDAP